MGQLEFNDSIKFVFFFFIYFSNLHGLTLKLSIGNMKEVIVKDINFSTPCRPRLNNFFFFLKTNYKKPIIHKKR